MSGRTLPLPAADGADQAPGQQADQRGAAAKVLPIFAIQGARVAGSVISCRIALGPLRAATPPATPSHGRAVGLEAVAMTQDTTADHDRRLAVTS